MGGGGCSSFEKVVRSNVFSRKMFLDSLRWATYQAYCSCASWSKSELFVNYVSS